MASFDISEQFSSAYSLIRLLPLVILAVHLTLWCTLLSRRRKYLRSVWRSPRARLLVVALAGIRLPLQFVLTGVTDNGATMTEPAPEEAAAALRTVREGRDRVFASAVGARWLSIVSGLVVFLYAAAIDLFAAAQPWLNVAAVVFVLAIVVGPRTRVGSALLGRPVTVSSRSVPLTFRWRLLGIAPVLGIGIAVVLIVLLFHLSHGGIYYGALAGLYIMPFGPRFQLWLLRRQDKD